jgi:hypothetical protein
VIGPKPNLIDDFEGDVISRLRLRGVLFRRLLVSFTAHLVLLLLLPVDLFDRLIYVPFSICIFRRNKSGKTPRILWLKNCGIGLSAVQAPKTSELSQ